jgi:hypothetical protein
MLPSPAEVETARRVLEAIAEHRSPTQSDALVLRLWAGPRNGMRPLKDIAKEVTEAAGRKM